MRYGVVELGSSVAPPAMLYDVDGAGQCTGSTAFLDHSPYFAIACNPGPDRDGTTRCLPEGLRIEDAFSDAACTIPVRFATDIRIPECRDAPGAPYPSLLGSDGAHVYRIGPESHEAMYLPDPFSGVCGRRASLNEVIFEVIEVAPSALALIEKVQE